MTDSAAALGRFIVIEGLDGSGKSTQVALLKQALEKLGRRVAVTHEPTDAAVGGMIRETLAGLAPRSDAELAALFLADRIRHNTNPVNGIQKLLLDGTDVLCDRYYYSSLAYQSLTVDLDWLVAANCGCPAIRKPDLCIFLDVDAARCKERMDTSRHFLEIFERSGEQMERIRQNFFAAFDRIRGGENIVILDAVKDADELAQEIALLTAPLFASIKNPL